MGNIGNIFVRAGEEPLSTRIRRGRAGWAALPLFGLIIPAILQMAGIDWAQRLIDIGGSHILPAYPATKGLQGTALEFATYGQKLLISISYVGVLLFLLTFQIAWWMRSDMIEQLRTGLETAGSKILDEVKRENGRSGRIETVMNEVRNKLSDPQKPEKVRIALFDSLLIYAPLFVAQGMGYFEEEGLAVEFDFSVGDDEAVAEAVKAGTHDFGACDPYFCLPKTSTQEASETDLLILMPLAKRFGFTLLGKQNVVERLSGTTPITIGTYEEGSTTYLAAQAFRKWLIGEMVRRGGPSSDRAKIGKNIELKPLKVTDQVFDSPEALELAVAQLDFVLLWEPQTSWIRKANAEEGLGFGIVGVPLATKKKTPPTDVANKNSRPILKICEGTPKGASGLLDEEWRVWRPPFGEKELHKCLVSALLARRSLVSTRSVLCRRVFRALSRASVHLQGLDWELDLEARKANRRSLIGAVESLLRGSEHITPEVLREMVGFQTAPTVASGERGGLFPFVYGLSHYEPNHYLEQLRSCHNLWHENQAEKGPAMWAVSHYDRFFVKPAELEKTP